MCEYGMVTLDWEGSHCELHTVPATQKAEGSLGSLVRKQWPPPISKHRNGDSHRKEHSTEELKSFMGFNLSQPHSGDSKAFPEQSPPA